MKTFNLKLMLSLGVFAFTGLLLSLPVSAAKISGLYTAEVLVAEQSVSVEPEVARQALTQVLVKVTGREDVASLSRLKPMLDNPLPLILKYSYEATTKPITEEQGHELLAQRLRVEFSQGLLEQKLAEADVRPLGANRPGVLVWLAEEKGGAREYLGLEDDPVVLNQLRATAAERGLPVFRPLLDIEDESALPVSDSWGFFTDSIRKASARYQPDSILVGRIFSQRGKWQTQWLLIWGNDVSQFSGQGSTLREQIDQAVNQVANKLFADFVRPSGGYAENGLRLEVSGVNQLADYFQITDFLADLPSINGVVLEHLSGDTLVLRLDVDGTLQQLQRAIGLNQRFVMDALPNETPHITGMEAPAPVVNEPSLRYRWQG